MASKLIERIQNLMALALNNPSEEEARSAAMQVVKLIEENKLNLGGVPAMHINTSKAYKPDADFDSTFSDLTKPTDAQEEYQGGSAGEAGLKLADVIADLDDDFMRKKVTRAWRALRDERKKLEGEIHRYELESRRKYPRG